MNFKKLLLLAQKRAASDVILKEKCPPYIKIDGKIQTLKQLKEVTIPALWIDDAIVQVLSEEQIQQLKQERSIDTSFAFEGVGYVRIHAFYSRDCLEVIFRFIKDKADSLIELNLNSKLEHLVQNIRHGLILISGRTGEGKSSTARAWLNEINNTQTKHIVTLENPIELIFKDNKSIFSQRSLGTDFKEFSKGVSDAMRANPDVLFLGEMRDEKTVTAAINAAETGHLVISTIHSRSCIETITRLCEGSDQGAKLTKLSYALQLVVNQTLLQGESSGSAYPALEMLRVNSVIRNYITKKEFSNIERHMERGESNDCCSMTASILHLLKQELITIEEALAKAPNPQKIESIYNSPIRQKKHMSEAEGGRDPFKGQDIRWEKVQPLELSEVSSHSEKLKVKKRR